MNKIHGRRFPLDYPGKKHLVVFRNSNGKVVDHAWMTSEEQREMQLTNNR